MALTNEFDSEKVNGVIELKHYSELPDYATQWPIVGRGGRLGWEYRVHQTYNVPSNPAFSVFGISPDSHLVCFVDVEKTRVSPTLVLALIKSQHYRRFYIARWVGGAYPDAQALYKPYRRVLNRHLQAVVNPDDYINFRPRHKAYHSDYYRGAGPEPASALAVPRYRTPPPPKTVSTAPLDNEDSKPALKQEFETNLEGNHTEVKTDEEEYDSADQPLPQVDTKEAELLATISEQAEIIQRMFLTFKTLSKDLRSVSKNAERILGKYGNTPQAKK